MAVDAGFDAPVLFQTYVLNTTQAALARIKATGQALPDEQDRDLALYSLDYALKLPDAWPVTGSLLTTLAPKMEQAGHRRDWIMFLDAGIDASRACGDLAIESELHLQKGILYQLLAEYEQADSQYVLSQAGFTALSDQRGLARVLNRRAFVTRRLGRYREAEEHAAAAMALLAADDPELGYSYQVLGTIAYDRMQWQEAARRFEQSLDLLAGSDDRRRLGWAYSNLGLALWQTGDLAAAEANLLQAMDIFAAIGDRIHQSVAQMNLGNVLVARGKLEQALQVYMEAEVVFRKAQDVERMASVNNNLGKVYREMERFADALAPARLGVEYYGQLHQPVELINSLEGVGETCVGLGNWSDAAEAYRAALSHIDEVDNAAWQAGKRAEIDAILRDIEQQAIATD
ncbi:MAG: tetratricopeptide repeat protein [Anaerolineae bacterium]|nr:tetratricopeptide repeat protein [Anaerolineae bacterium]